MATLLMGQTACTSRSGRTTYSGPKAAPSRDTPSVEDRGRGAGFPSCLFSHLDIQRVMDASQGAVPLPQVQIRPNRAARREVFRQRLPLAPRPEDIEDRVQDLADIHRPRTPAAFGRSDQGSNQRPFGVSQITRVA